MKKKKKINHPTLFKGINVFIICGGYDMPHARIKMIKDRVKQRMGNVLEKYSSEVTIIIASLSLSKLVLLKHLPEEKMNLVHSPEWISESLRLGRLMEYNEHTWCLHKKRKLTTDKQDHSPQHSLQRAKKIEIESEALTLSQLSSKQDSTFQKSITSSPIDISQFPTFQTIEHNDYTDKNKTSKIPPTKTKTKSNNSLNFNSDDDKSDHFVKVKEMTNDLENENKMTTDLVNDFVFSSTSNNLQSNNSTERKYNILNKYTMEKKKEYLKNSTEKEKIPINIDVCTGQDQEKVYTININTEEKKNLIGKITDEKISIKINEKRLLNIQKNLACQITKNGISKNLNTSISDIFSELQDIYGCLGDEWRKFAYQKATGIIRKLPFKISNHHDVDDIVKRRGIGKKFAKKIKEIISTGTLKRLNQLKTIERVKIIKLFAGIWGVGPTTAVKWYHQGLRTLDDLSSNQTLLNNNQKIGLKYYTDLQTKIPRSEIELLKPIIKRIATDIMQNVICDVVGSYRRGKTLCGDVDILFTHPSWSIESKISDQTPTFLDTPNHLKHRLHHFISSLTNTLKDQKIIKDDLILSHYDSEKDSTSCTYMGIYQLSSNLPHRRIDIKAYPYNEYAFALLYFTGSGHFNRSMRWYAKKLGYSLTDHGISKAIRVHREKIATGNVSHFNTERDIFEFLRLEYIIPTERNCYENFNLEENEDNHNH